MLYTIIIVVIGRIGSLYLFLHYIYYAHGCNKHIDCNEYGHKPLGVSTF